MSSRSKGSEEIGEKCLEGNLARIRGRHPRLAQAILDSETGDGEILVGPRGHATVSWGGTLLGSAYEPGQEGERLAEQIDDEPADILIAVGFALGHHLEAYRARNACPIIIYEPSLGRLRAALSARPGLTLLGRDDVTLTDDEDEVSGCLRGLYTPGLRIRVFPHPSALRLAPDAVREIVDRVGRVKDGSDLRIRTNLFMAEKWARTTVENTRHLIETPSAGNLFDAFPDVPAVVCAAGPSLNKQLPLLAEARDRVLVFAIGQSVKPLRDAGIEPDLVTVIENQDVTHQLERAGDCSNLALVLPSQAHPRLFEIPVRARFLAHPVAYPFGVWVARALGEVRGLATGGTVAQFAVYLAAAFGARPILLLGQDLAYTDGRAYAAGSVYDSIAFEEAEDGKLELTGYKKKWELFGRPEESDRLEDQLIWVEGWDGKPVATNPSYASFREHYRELAAFLAKKDIQVVNCTEGGARIPDVEHLSFRAALDRWGTKSVEVRSHVLAIHDEAPRHEPGIFDGPIAEARKNLDRLERATHKGMKVAREAKKGLRAASQARQIDILKDVKRAEKRVFEGLRKLPFLDAIVQPLLVEITAAGRRLDRIGAEPDQLAEHSRARLQGTLEGVAKARELLDGLETHLATLKDEVPASDRGLAPRPLGGSPAG